MVKDRVTATSLWRVGRSAVTRNVERNGQRPNVFRKKKESKYQVAGSRERMLLMLLLGNLASVLADQARRYRAAR